MQGEAGIAGSPSHCEENWATKTFNCSFYEEIAGPRSIVCPLPSPIPSPFLPARWCWTHGCRLGVQVDGLPGLHDWFGGRDQVVQRQAERHSVVLAFAKGQ